ncbi:MAG TPA: DUF3857 and transglutaminase domain-containing protein [Moraxellaceae bacterium]|nr:DUF3857 and transglutaminase domain-containing protein [Moraxellaceae bacterium]
MAGSRPTSQHPPVSPRRPLSLAAALLMVLAAPVHADDRDAASDIGLRYDDYSIRYDLNADGSFVRTAVFTVTVLKESAIEEAKQDSNSFSTSIAEGEYVEAWTQKAKGNRIPVPKDNYQSNVAGGHKKGSPFYSDYTTVSVVFPDVEVGDQVHAVWRETVKEPIFPGQFTERDDLSRYTAYTHADLTVTMPVSYKLRSQAWHLKEAAPREENGRRIWQWTYENPVPEKWSPESAGIERLEDDPVLLLSTLDDYRQIVDSYATRARPKATVTPRIQTLADSITKKSTTPAEKARALYEWTQKNITYGGNCIGVGAVVPRDLDVVLDNRIGDCKDHATLLQALLTAEGIPSSQALVNAGQLYDLPELPVVANINHVINYLPTLGLFLDSTSSDTPFGRLPFGDADKPVLLVDGYKPGLRTPADRGMADSQHTVTHLRLNSDGSASGEMDVKASGLPAVTIQRGLRDIPPTRRAEAMKRWLKSNGLQGTGELQPDAGFDPQGGYHVHISLALKDFLQNTEAGAFPLRPLLGGNATFAAVVGPVQDDEPKKARSCSGGNVSEEYVVEFPADMKVVYLPRSRTLTRDGVHYSASYAQQGNTVTLTRTINGTVKSNICSPAQLAERVELAREVRREQRSQLLYQQVQ